MLKLLELYSGIGGMRYAVEASGQPYEVVAAVDINTVVNQVYCLNFDPKNHMQRNIQSFTVQEIDSFEADIITMSPPCQPFTRLGLRLDSEDPRNESFLHFLNILCELKRKPSYFLLENVMGFEISDARKILIKTLSQCDYSFQEFLLSPIQFGIPNSRMRYYIIAKKSSLQFDFALTSEILKNLPEGKKFRFSKYSCDKCKNVQETNVEGAKCVIKHFLEINEHSYFESFKVPNSILSKHAYVFDIVEEDSTSSCCFTKGYMHFHQGTGSILHPSNSLKVSDIYASASSVEDINKKTEILKTLNLRYFTPREIANIMCFPQNFRFPENLSLKQKYRALGNSLNVFVVATLFKLLFTES